MHGEGDRDATDATPAGPPRADPARADAPLSGAGLRAARARDRADLLAGFRARFYLPEGRIYLDGNSLGLLSKDAEAALLRALAGWREHAIDGFLRADPPWFDLGERLGALAAPLLGAEPGAVVFGSATTVAIHNLLRTFFRPEGRRRRIVADRINFPSDVYALEAVVLERGLDPDDAIRWVPSHDGRTVEEADIEAALDETVALAFFPSVYYVSGQLLDIPRLTRAAHEAGALAGFDLCHSIGVIPHELDRWGVDFAVFCGYKYLNGGPGAAAGLYVNRRHWGRRPALAGWWGYRKERQFDMDPAFEPAPHAGAFQVGTVHVLSAAPLLGSLAMLAEAGIERVRRKSLALTDFLASALAELPREFGLRIVTPLAPARRGGHIAVAHPEAARIAKALKARGVVPDHRPPDVIRLCPSPLYTSFEDVWRAVECLREVMADEAWRA
ncbi:MAG: kynureninase, partial [Clostridia bacterium]|nr:kynureninase [Clostridia bacterium]